MKAVAVLICALLLIGEAPAAAADAGAPAPAVSTPPIFRSNRVAFPMPRRESRSSLFFRRHWIG